jgi:hypothetical protein
VQTKHTKFENPRLDTVVLGGRTLAQVVSMMDRMKGIFDVIDIHNTKGSRRSVFTDVRHYTTSSPSYSYKRLGCFDNLELLGDSMLPFGKEVWKMHIAHHPRPIKKVPKFWPIINGKTLEKAIEQSQISFVIAPKIDVSSDLDAVEHFIDRCNKSLSSIGEWVRLDLCMCVECACGRTSMINAKDCFARIPALVKTSDVLKRMRCTRCDDYGVVDTRAYHKDWSSASSRYMTGKYSRSSSFKGGLDELYENVAGDGTSPAYLSDGLYIDPDGTIHE